MMKKRIFILSMVLAFPAFAECDIHGKCVWDCSPSGKSSCTATFENGTLSISGTEMKGSFGYHIDTDTYNITNAPWNDEAGHLKQITNVVIGPEMTNIGSWFLTGATNLEHISIPENITSIGAYSFYHTGLKSVDWPSNLKTLPSGIFQYTGLTDLSFLDGVETIGVAAFNGTFWYGKSPDTIVIPDSVTTIQNHAFTGNTVLKNIILSDQTTSISTGAFGSNLEKIYCTGNLETCKANVGDALADKVQQATAKKINGVSYIYDKSGKLIATSGKRINKRIYTAEEAAMVAGKTNTIKLRYK